MASKDRQVAQATATLKELAAIDISNPETHSDIIRKCQSIISALQDPITVLTDIFAGGTSYPCIVALSNLGVFTKLARANGPLTAAQLAEQCDAERGLIVRLMRVATAEGIVTETGPETYTAAPATNILAIPAAAAGLRVNHRTSKVVHSLPDYLNECHHRAPASYTNGLFQYHHKTDLGAFEYWAHNDEWTREFNLFMTLHNQIGQNWAEECNAKRLIFDGVEIDPSVPLVVDIGGGIGQDLRLLKKHLGSQVSKGQLVLEDLAHVIDNIPRDMHDGDIKYVKYDMFTPQPVKGARIYCLKTVLHDWPDDKVLEILRHTAASLTPGKSKVWLLNPIVPDMGVSKGLVWADISMMALHASLERTEAQWVQLLAEAGLKITNVQIMAHNYGLIEAELEG
ncbi:S-adenosyl-L-methionine-dependent methyltransferase [Aspergillus falconensis]